MDPRRVARFGLASALVLLLGLLASGPATVVAALVVAYVLHMRAATRA